jgi:hypothetical protein
MLETQNLYICQSIFHCYITRKKRKKHFIVFLLIISKALQMAYSTAQSHFIVAQPQTHVVVNADPFKQLHHEWSVGLCNCCDDMSQCELKR